MAQRPGAVRRRGVAAVIMVLVLLLAGLLVISLVIRGGRDQQLTVRRLETVRSFYAAEGGMNMAIAELINDSDDDGDGIIGSISDDGNDANDPALGSARFLVELDTVGLQTVLTSWGRSGESRRRVKATLEAQ